MDEFNFKLAQYCINEIFELSESYLGDFKMDIIKWCNAILSEILLVISNQAYVFSPNCTPLGSITIINSISRFSAKRENKY